jgi:hypothetical protein
MMNKRSEIPTDRAANMDERVVFVHIAQMPEKAASTESAGSPGGE